MKTARQTPAILGSLILFLGLTACGDRYTPWETDVPSKLENLTAQQISALNEIDDQTLPVTIAVMGDPQGTPKDLEKVVDAINRRNDVKFILVLGDLTDYGLLHEYIWAGEALKRSRIPFLTAVGNHDAIAHGKTIYSKMFGPTNYTFDYAGLQFVMFNSNQFEYGPSDFNWLQRTMDSRSIVGSHVPPMVDMHNQNEIDHWYSINTQAGIIASLHGHRGTKVDQHWDKYGIPYFIVAKLSGRRYTLMTIHEDRTLSFQSCKNECGELQ